VRDEGLGLSARLLLDAVKVLQIREAGRALGLMAMVLARRRASEGCKKDVLDEVWSPRRCGWVKVGKKK
jgi:hypothetical protein